MRVVTDAEKTAIAHDWVAAWNQHDLDAIMAHYAADIEFQASTVVSRWNRPNGILHGVRELREQFARGLEIAPNLHFTIEAVYHSPDGYAVCYVRENGNRAIDAVELDGRGAAIRVHAYYLSAQP